MREPLPRAVRLHPARLRVQRLLQAKFRTEEVPAAPSRGRLSNVAMRTFPGITSRPFSVLTAEIASCRVRNSREAVPSCSEYLRSTI